MVSIRLTNFDRDYANLGYTFDLVIDGKNMVPALYGGEMGVNQDLRFMIDPLAEETEDVIDEGDYVRD